MKINEKLKKYELEILEELIKICEKHNLKYYLAYGSALGAVRHKGFIPWDDDIDIHMPSSDIIKLREICQKELDKKFYYQDKLTDKYYYNYFSKIGLENTTWMPKDRFVDCKYGICIDIFPIFPLKDTKKDRKRIDKYMKLLLITSAKYYVLYGNKKYYSKTKKLIHKIIPEFINNYLYSLAYKKLSYDKDDYDLIMIHSISYKKKHYFKREDIEGENLLKFEKHKLPVVKNVDKYLTAFYGDYMTPPEESKRYGHDSTGDELIYDFENSYKKYQGDKHD